MNARDSGSSMLASLFNPPPVVPPPAGASIRQHRLDDASKSAGKLRGSAATATRAATPRVTSDPPATPTTLTEFSAADKSLIRRLHGYMAPLQLLGVLNERLVADRGDDVPAFTLDQLRAEIATVTTAVPGGAGDWGSMRKLLAKARASGLLAKINEQVIDDFALAFALSDRQVMSLKDILLTMGDD